MSTSSRTTLSLLTAHDDHPQPAIALRLSEEVLEDVKKAVKRPEGVHFIAGNIPGFRVGRQTIDVNLSGEALPHEVYSAEDDPKQQYQRRAIVAHIAQLKLPDNRDAREEDAALEALKNSMAALKQEKQASSTSYSNAVLAVPKNRFEAAREMKKHNRNGSLLSQNASPILGASTTPRIAPTSVPVNDRAARIKAMRTPLIHLLAVRAADFETILRKTHIPRRDLDEYLPKIAQLDKDKWHLLNKAYRELDVWKFAYASQEDRDAAVERAARAYDRMRVDKYDDLWQQLLPKEKRGKGIYLSKVQLNDDSTGPSPRLASKPKTSLEKRLFSKDPAKQRAIAAAKETKRKEREDAREAAKTASEAEDKPPRKKQATAASKAKVKSAEFVGASDESGEDGEIKAGGAVKSSLTHGVASKPKPSPRVDAAASKANGKTTAASSADPKAATKPRPKENSTPLPSKPVKAPAVDSPRVAPKTASKPSALGKATPNGLSAPVTNQKSQLSPQRPDSRPSNPSPLGAARPRVASDVSDKNAIGVQRPRQGAETPKGLGITNGTTRKRQDTVTSMASQTSIASFSSSDNKASSEKKINGLPKLPTNKGRDGASASPAIHKKQQPNGMGVAHKTDGTTLKRKIPHSEDKDSSTPAPPAKHRKTESSSSSANSQIKATPNGVSTGGNTFDSVSSDSSTSIIDNITFNQGVALAQKFQEQFYPAYEKLYDEQMAMEKRGERVPDEERERLIKMHHRLAEMKAQIAAASEREGRGDES